ncbi:hypothetical protein B0H14DRAFT_3534407 [Mycena olivaceomarginata]|nr:hypothetical protein B0H14DRAFT_3534407 [Mycena olivaceomarginata]
MAMATRRSKRQQKRNPDPDALPPPPPPRRIKGAKKEAAGPSVPKDHRARSKNDASLPIVPAPALAAKRKQAEAGGDSEDDHVNKKARQTADSDDERPAPAPPRDTTEVGGDSQDTDVDKDGSDDEHPTPAPPRDTTEATDSQDTDVDKNGRHDTSDIQDEEGDVQDEEGDHQFEGSGGTVSVKEQKLQQLAKNSLLLSLQLPPQQQQVPTFKGTIYDPNLRRTGNASSRYQYRVSNGLLLSLPQQGTSSFESNTDAHRGRWVPPRGEGAHDQADEEDLEVASRTGTPFPDNFDATHDSPDDDVVMPLDDDNDSDHSNFSTTHAAAEEALRLKNRTMTDNGWVATMDTREEEDFDLEEDYLQDVAKPKGKGKAAAVESSDVEEDPFPVASDDDEDQDDDKTPNGHITPWDVSPGQLSSALLKEAMAARAAYHATLEDIARRGRKKISSVRMAIGDYPKSTRDANSWNAYQMKYCIEHPRPSKMTREESRAYAKAREDGYNALFASLSDDERRDPEARRLCVEPLMKWHREKTMQVVDNRKADGGGKALMNKAVAPLIHQARIIPTWYGRFLTCLQSTAVSNSLDIEIFGLALDCYGDNAIIWGGGALFQEVFKQHPVPIRKFLIDMKALFQTTSLYLRNQAETAEAVSMMQPVPITFTRLPSEASNRDALRRQLTGLFVNQICLVMIERGELELEQIKTTFQKMSWKWSNDAWKHKLRIENWPAALKETYPGPGFSLGVITEKDDKKEEKRARMDAVKAMFKAMQAAYQSPDADDGLECTRIVSWTDEEMELEDPSNVPIVSCDDGTVLLRASASKGLLAKIKKSKKKSSKKRTRATANASSVDDTDDEDEMPPPPPKSAKGKGKAPTAAGSLAPAAASDVAPVAGRKQIKFRYRNGEAMSDVFSATELVRYTGTTPTNVQQNILMYSDATGKWTLLPPGFEPRISLDLEAICEVYRLNIGLL